MFGDLRAFTMKDFQDNKEYPFLGVRYAKRFYLRCPFCSQKMTGIKFRSNDMFVLRPVCLDCNVTFTDNSVKSFGLVSDDQQEDLTFDDLEILKSYFTRLNSLNLNSSTFCKVDEHRCVVNIHLTSLNDRLFQKYFFVVCKLCRTVECLEVSDDRYKFLYEMKYAEQYFDTLF